MRLRPRTLAARTIGVLLLGLVLAQLLGVAIDVLDRGRAFYRSTTLQAAAQISDIAKALDAVRPEQRPGIIARISGRKLSIALAAGPRLAESVSEKRYARAFQTLVRRELGPGFDVHVILHQTARRLGNRAAFFSDAPANALDRYLTVELLYLAPRGFAFVTHVRLHDGSWVTFSAPLPYEHITRLYVLLPKILIMLAVVIALLLVAVRWVTRPMKKMAAAALALGQNLDRVPLAETGPEEIRATARALNVMQLRIQEYVRDRAAMLAALSHDLKTFITRLRLRAELLPESPHRERLVADLGEMSAMVDATLGYLHDSNPARGRAPFDITALIESIRIDAEDMGWPVSVSGAAREPYLGNAQEIRRCVMNLVENGVKYGGRATIRLEDRGDELTIAVCDPGPGIPPEERDRVFEPFYRGGCAELREGAGTGLGLHIARTIARAHGGEVLLRPETPGSFCVAVRLPRPKPARGRQIG